MCIRDRWICTNPDTPIVVQELSFYPFVEHDHKRRREYCALRNQFARKIIYKEFTVAVVFAEQYISAVGDYILSKNPDVDFCAIVNLPKSVFLRTRREGLNLGIDIARPLGGGGHPKAAAYQLDFSDKEIKEMIRLCEQQCSDSYQ